MPLPQASGEQLLFTGVSASDNDHFPAYSNWCLTDKRQPQTVAQKYIWTHIYSRKHTFWPSTYWDDYNLSGPLKNKTKNNGCFIMKSQTVSMFGYIRNSPALSFLFSVKTLPKSTSVVFLTIHENAAPNSMRRHWRLTTDPDIHQFSLRDKKVEGGGSVIEKKRKRKERGLLLHYHHPL